MDVLVAGYNAQALAETKVYIAHLLLSRVSLCVSFLPADWPQRHPPPAAGVGGGGTDPTATGACCSPNFHCCPCAGRHSIPCLGRTSTFKVCWTQLTLLT
jgi:hypothetical protein